MEKLKNVVLFSVLLIVLQSYICPKYHPEISWKEISNEKFIIVFPSGYETEALYTLNTAEQLYDQLFELWGGWVQIHGRTRILLSDVYDVSNGSATFFPYNQVEIYLSTPPPDSTIGNAKDWIKMALAHELTHIFNFNAGSGFTYFMRKILGSNPLLFPTLIMPGWLEEGFAIYAESQIDEGGRLNTPDYRLMLRKITEAGKMPNWGNIWGFPTHWPGRMSKYLYGAAFIKFLADTYGHSKIPEFLKNFAQNPIPITITKDLKPVKLNVRQRLKNVFGKNLSTLWNEFLRQVENQCPEPTGNKSHNPSSPLTLLTKKGKYNEYPLFGDQDNIFYANHNYKEYPGIYSLNIKNNKTRRLIDKSGINGMFYSQSEDKIYFSAIDYYKSFYKYSDIYVLDLHKQTFEQLSKGKRLFYPAKSSIERNKIYCVQRIQNKSYLAVLDLETGNTNTLSQGYTSIAYPAVSPDNRYIAASIKTNHKEWAIGLFNLNGELEKLVTDGRIKCYYTTWKNAKELFFICGYRKSYKLACYNLNSESFQIFDDPQLPALRYFTLEPGKNKTKIAVSIYDANGFNLALVNIDELKRKRLSKDKINLSSASKTIKHTAKKNPPPNPHSYKIRPYHFFREMIPKYINGAYRNGGNEIQPGILIGSHDLLMKHSFTMEAFYGLQSRTANFILNYTFDGFYPTLSIRYSDLSEFNHTPIRGDFIYKERKFELISLYPLLIKNRNQAYLYSNIHFETVGNHLPELPTNDRIKFNGLKLGLFFNSAKKYYDSISFADGLSFSLSYSREFKWMGSDYDIKTAAFQYKHFLSLFRPNVFAIRLGVMDSWGEARRLFYMGGSKTQEKYHTAGNNFFDLMRGYSAGYFEGTGGYLLNLEYRISLLKIEKYFWGSTNFERLYLSIFTDIGNLWKKQWRFDPAYSLGLELNMVLTISDIKIEISTGSAIGYNPYHSPIIYLRLGNSF